jgi:hypothetical protein
MLGCAQCGQSFVSVFTESIDWEGGDDPQYWTLLPVTPEEASDLCRQGDAVSEAALSALGPGRRSLHYDNPKGGAQRIFWGAGLFVGFHD